MNLLRLLFAFSLLVSVAESQETRPSGIELRDVDSSVRPQDNLFQYVCGEWLQHVAIPPDKSTYGTFEILMDEAEENIREIITEAVESDASQGSLEQKIGDFFLSYMNEEAIAANGLNPLQGELEKIDALENKEQIIEHFGYLLTVDVLSPIGFYVDQDDKQSTQYLPVIIQGGTTLPDRDYYLENEPKYLDAQQALKDYIARIFQLSSLPDGPEAAEAILDLETQLARIQWTKTQLRDAHKRYNKQELGQLHELAPNLAWNEFFAAAEVPSLAELNVSTPSYFESLPAIVESVPLEVWKQYLKFHLIDSYAPALTEDYVDANFQLYGKVLSGTEEIKPRWKRAVQTLAGGRGFGVLGDAVGELYVKKHYPPQARKRMDELIFNLLQAYQSSIRDLTWMTPDTKERALEKLAKITTKIGYTKKWRDYSKLEIKPNDLVGNLLRSSEVEYQRMIDKLGKPVDRDEWYMTPHTINAYYNPGMNEIVFPAAILQPPFFDFEADDAVNYGSIGSVIGHEISHAFDDQGSKYDGQGNLNDWWTDEDRTAFHALTSQLVDQYNQYTPLYGKSVNGELTLGENIADLSGMSIAYKAYLLSLDGKEPPVIDGWTGPQRFFLGWTQSWKRKYRDAEMVNRLLTDPHSPPEYRANGPLTNFDPFYDAFGVQPEDGLYKPPGERIRIW